MNDNFPVSLDSVLRSEGGKVDDPHDPGGRTAFGITQRVYDDWRGPRGTRDVFLIEHAEIEAIYRKLYWDACHCSELPAGVDYCTFDFAVNSGPGRATRFLQRAASVADDGQLGPVSIAAINAKPASDIIEAVCEDRLIYLERLPTFARFGKGWTARVRDVEAKAREMVA